MVLCPLDPSHDILQPRLQYHIVKCMKNHPDTKLVICPFDAIHLVAPIEYEHHISTCPSSGNVRNFKISLEPQRKVGVVSLEEAGSKDTVYCDDDDWNGDHASYVPEAATENRNVARMLTGASKSQRKQFRKAERARISAIDGTGDVPKPSFFDRTDPEKPLRPPKNAAKALELEKGDRLSRNIDRMISRFQKIGLKSTDDQNSGSDKDDSLSGNEDFSFTKGNSSFKKGISSLKAENVNLNGKDLSFNNGNSAIKNKPANFNDEDLSFNKGNSNLTKGNSSLTKGNFTGKNEITETPSEIVKIQKETPEMLIINAETTDQNVENSRSNVETLIAKAEMTKKNVRLLNQSAEGPSTIDGPRKITKKSVTVAEMLCKSREISRGLNGAKKISTGRGFTIAFQNLKKLESTSVENCESIYGYNDEEEEELDLDLEIQQ